MGNNNRDKEAEENMKASSLVVIATVRNYLLTGIFSLPNRPILPSPIGNIYQRIPEDILCPAIAFHILLFEAQSLT